MALLIFSRRTNNPHAVTAPLESHDLVIPHLHLEDRSKENDFPSLDDEANDLLDGSPLLDSVLGPEHVPMEAGKLEIFEPLSELLGVKTLALRLGPSKHEVIGSSRTCWGHSGAHRVLRKTLSLGAKWRKIRATGG